MVFKKHVDLMELLNRKLLEVQKLEALMEIDAEWGKDPWKSLPGEQLNNYMGSKPEHRPTTNFKIAYDNKAVYFIFRVEDRYVRAVAERYQGAVYKDSCVEFFFSPNSHVLSGYFNLEINCGGAALFEYHPAGGRDFIRIPEVDFRQIHIAHSMPRIVEPEIKQAITWTVECRVPVDILKSYCSVMFPAPGAIWRGNFYKCADNTSHPHWLSWAPVEFPTPRFHLPEFFGELRFCS